MSFLLYAFQRQLGIYCICYSDLLNGKWRVASQTCDIDFLRGVRSSLPDWGLGAVLSWDHRFWSLINQQVDVNIKGNLFSHRILLENFDVWQNFKLKYVWTRFLSQKYSSWADCDSYTWTPASLCASLQIVWLAKSALVVILANCRASLLRSHSFQRYSPPVLALSGCTTVWTYKFNFLYLSDCLSLMAKTFFKIPTIHLKCIKSQDYSWQLNSSNIFPKYTHYGL